MLLKGTGSDIQAFGTVWNALIGIRVSAEMYFNDK